MSYQELQFTNLSGGPPVSIANYRFKEDISSELKAWEGNHELSFSDIPVDVTSLPENPLTEVLSIDTKAHQELGPIPLRFEIESKEGLTLVIPSLNFRVMRIASGETIYSNEFEQYPLHIVAIAEPENKKLLLRSSLDYRGLTIEQALNLTEFFHALALGGELRLFATFNSEGKEDVIQVLRGYLEPGRYKGPNRHLLKILELLQFIQEKTGNFFIIPEDGISPEDYKNILAIADILQSGHATYSAGPWITESTQEQVQSAIKTYESGAPVPIIVLYEGQSVKILGTWISLGPVLFSLEKTYISLEDLTNLRRQIEAHTTGFMQIRITPVSNCHAEAKYLRWLPTDEVEDIRKLPIFNQVKEDRTPINVEAALALLQSWHNEDPEKQRETLDILEAVKKEDHPFKPFTEHE